MKPVTLTKTLLIDLRKLIANAKQDAARSVNSTLVILYWNIGQRIRKEILKEKLHEALASAKARLSRHAITPFHEKH